MPAVCGAQPGLRARGVGVGVRVLARPTKADAHRNCTSPVSVCMTSCVRKQELKAECMSVCMTSCVHGMQ